MVGKRSSEWCQGCFREFLAYVTAPGGVLGGPWGVLGAPWVVFGVHLGSLGCLKVSLEGPLGHSGGLVGVLGVLLVALGGVVSFMGRSGSGFREFPGDSRSHFGSI